MSASRAAVFRRGCCISFSSIEDNSSYRTPWIMPAELDAAGAVYGTYNAPREWYATVGMKY